MFATAFSWMRSRKFYFSFHLSNKKSRGNKVQYIFYGRNGSKLWYTLIGEITFLGLHSARWKPELSISHSHAHTRIDAVGEDLGEISSHIRRPFSVWAMLKGQIRIPAVQIPAGIVAACSCRPDPRGSPHLFITYRAPRNRQDPERSRMIADSDGISRKKSAVY
jgi:hypothetical protein